MKMNNELAQNAIITGLNVLNDDEIRIPSSKVEALAYFKDILRGLLNGDLILATPDRIVPESNLTELPKKEPASEEGAEGK